MSRKVNELFLLMSNLAQQNDLDIMRSLFIEGLQTIFHDPTIQWMNKNNQLEELMEVCTNRKSYGFINITGEEPKEHLDIIHNAIQMFAVFIEKVEQQKMLLDNEKQLNTIVEQRTKEIAEVKERFQLAVEGSRDALWDWNLETNDAYISDQFAVMLGFEPGELPNSSKAWSDLLHPDDKEKAFKTVNDYLENQNDYYESTFRMRTKDGDYKWITGRGKALFDEQGKPIRFVGFNTDITDRLKYLEQIHEKEELYRTVVENTGTAIIIIEEDTTIRYVNEEFTRLYGASRGEIEGKLSWTTFVDAEDLKRMKYFHDLRRVDPSKAPGSYDFRLINKRGESRYIHITIDMIPGTKRSVASFMDVTERRRAEQELMQKNSELSAAEEELKASNEELWEINKHIERQNRELEEAKEKAQESDRLKSAFLANMSHEIRTPMNGIMGFADLLKNTDLSSNKRQQYLDIIQDSGKRMLNIINELIDISKIEAKQMEVKYEETNVYQLVDSIYAFFKPQAQKKGIYLTHKKGLKSSESIINTDKTKLTQVISNLIANALKFTSKGKVDMGFFQAGENLKFYVRDTGVGMKSETLTHIFDRFRQGDNGKEGINEGAGLGLSISRAYIEMLGGRIAVKSIFNKGTIFYFTIPFERTEKKTKKAKRPGRSISSIGENKVILVAEDDDNSYILLAELLEGSGFKVLRAVNGKEAIETARKNSSIHAILMDTKMPEMNGLEATEIIKSFKPGLPIISQSAFASDHDREEAINAGADAYFSKPVSGEELLSVLREYV
jgi:PAS domain S-box-containing protein